MQAPRTLLGNWLYQNSNICSPSIKRPSDKSLLIAFWGGTTPDRANAEYVPYQVLTIAACLALGWKNGTQVFIFWRHSNLRATKADQVPNSHLNGVSFLLGPAHNVRGNTLGLIREMFPLGLMALLESDFSGSYRSTHTGCVVTVMGCAGPSPSVTKLYVPSSRATTKQEQKRQVHETIPICCASPSLLIASKVPAN